MTAKEQETLFKKMLDEGDSPEFASGYVHGVFDESSGRPAPNPVMRNRVPACEPLVEDAYAFGYMVGFIDAYGEDAFDKPWGHDLQWLRPGFRYRWWLD